MKPIRLILALCSLAVAAAASAQPDTRFNRAPLQPRPYAELPIGAVKPAGWLNEQLVRMRDGMTGHLDSLYPQVMGPRNGWLGGDGDVWERGPYWIDGLLPLATSVVTFAMCDCFDTVGTLIGTAGSAGMLDENGNLPRGDKALIADAVATCTGALMGTSTVTTFVESSTGISEGARTGLSSVVVGILFLLGCVLAPIAGIIPSAATAPALIIVGMFMIGNVAKIDWSDVEVALPCFLTIAMMPFAYSISDGIGFGFISYTLIKMARGKFKEVPVLLYILSALFVVMYILAAL